MGFDKMHRTFHPLPKPRDKTTLSPQKFPCDAPLVSTPAPDLKAQERPICSLSL